MGTETPKSRPSHVESYSSGRMRIPVVDLNRKPTLQEGPSVTALGRYAIPRVTYSAVKRAPPS